MIEYRWKRSPDNPDKWYLVNQERYFKGRQHPNFHLYNYKLGHERFSKYSIRFNKIWSQEKMWRELKND